MKQFLVAWYDDDKKQRAALRHVEHVMPKPVSPLAEDGAASHMRRICATNLGANALDKIEVV